MVITRREIETEEREFRLVLTLLKSSLRPTRCTFITLGSVE